MLIDSTLFIGAVIIALTQVIKMLSPKVTGLVTIIVAVIVGVLVGLLDTSIGIANISVAQGILIALAAVGVHTTVTAATAKTVV
jgi:hypothetical protein